MSLRDLTDEEKSRREERWKFLKLSIYVEGGVSIAALIAGYWLQIPLWSTTTVSIEAIGLGIVGTVPLLVMLWLMRRSQIQSIAEIRQLLIEFLGKSLVCCSWLDLCLVALLAGLSEEFLFRGIIEPLIGRWSPIAGFALGNIVFGLCHAVTPMYFVYAAGIGCYLSWSVLWTGSPNLVVPISIHALYDLIAFIVIRRDYRVWVSRQLGGSADSDAEPLTETPASTDG